MDFNQFFKGFFGPHRGGSSSENQFPQDPYDPWSDHGDGENPTNFDNPFFENSSINLFRHLEDVFSNMFISSYGYVDMPQTDMIFPNDVSPRDAMLRESSDCDHNPSCQKSFIVNEESLADKDPNYVKEEFLKPEIFHSAPNRNFSFSKSFSVKTVRLPDGTFEEHRTSNDSEGNKVTTVRRCIGEQSHEITTHSNKHGLQEKEENFFNMDEKDAPAFEKLWQERKENSTPRNPAIDLRIKSDSKLSVPSGDPAYISLFKKFFG